MKINIRFLKQGFVKIEVPDDFTKKSKEEMLEHAQSFLDNMSDKEILDSMADFEDPANNGYFDETPPVAAIEDGETNELIVHTTDWEAYLKQPEIVEEKNG